MGYRWRDICCLISLTFALDYSSGAGGPLDLTVVYPVPGQRLAAVDSTFIFGSVDPKASLTINGSPVAIHGEGGWLAFLPVQPGRFDFNLLAERDGIVETLTVPVILPDPPVFSYDSLYFVPASFQPSVPLWVKPGDRINVSFAGTPSCNAFALVAGAGDTIFMRELTPRGYYGSRSVFQREGTDDGMTSESLMIRGIYEGTMTIPDTDGDSLTFITHLYPPSAAQIVWMINRDRGRDTPMLPVHKMLSLPAIKAETLTVPIRILPQNAISVVEFKDSLTVIRSGPQKGYLCIYQPAGIRAELVGREGAWLKIKLSGRTYGWVPDTSVMILPPGSSVPHSYISRIGTISSPDHTTIAVSTQNRHPFQVIENLREKSITVLIYGAESSTDWIRYDGNDSLIDYIIWSQPETDVYAMTVFLNTDRIWGYDAYYESRELRLAIRKGPSAKEDISEFRFVIDPGHSSDNGAIGPTGLKEKDVNLAIARELKTELERHGTEAVLTRDDDLPLALYDRPKIAVREKADIFISIHNNALPDGVNPFVNNGVSVFYYHPHSAQLARSVHNALVRRLDLPDFDWYYGNLAVARPTQYPAILVECAFMMIPEQEARLKTAEFRNQIARAIVEGVKDFLRGKPPTD